LSLTDLARKPAITWACDLARPSNGAALPFCAVLPLADHATAERGGTVRFQFKDGSEVTV